MRLLFMSMSPSLGVKSRCEMDTDDGMPGKLAGERSCRSCKKRGGCAMHEVPIPANSPRELGKLSRASPVAV